jgi:uncharacterized membrane protein YedE/YeeE
LSIRHSQWGALSAWAFSLALVVLGVLLVAANRSVETEIGRFTVNLVVAALSFSTVGVLVAHRQRNNPIGWLLLVIGILYATELFAGNYSVYTLVIPFRSIDVIEPPPPPPSPTRSSRSAA